MQPYNRMWVRCISELMHKINAVAHTIVVGGQVLRHAAPRRPSSSDEHTLFDQTGLPPAKPASRLARIVRYEYPALVVPSPAPEDLMPISRLKARCTLLGTFLLLSVGSTARAQQYSTWFFNGNCVDCAMAANTQTYAVSSVLTLQDYIEGSALTASNFVKFTYGGSNLMDPYAVSYEEDQPWVHHYPDLVDPISGALTNGGSQELFLSFGDGLRFELDTYGNWYTCGVHGEAYYGSPCDWQVNADYGNSGGFATRTSTVPEPGTLGLLAAGLGAVGVVSRRRRRAA